MVMTFLSTKRISALEVGSNGRGVQLAFLLKIICLTFSVSLMAQEKGRFNDESSWTQSFQSGQLEELVEKVKPSIVVISQSGRDGKPTGQGSGFLLADSGWVITNFHVIGEGRDLKVTDSEGLDHAVLEIHAWDRDWDLAALKVEGLDPANGLEWGSSDSARQGTPVIALGSPQGLNFSATLGIVSARREIEGMEMLQIAMPIEPGNSGGPLIDLEGKVHGIITMKSAITDNLGFAVPASRAIEMLAIPNTMSIEQWSRYGRLNPASWINVFDGNWRRQAGKIEVSGWASGFGGRTLLLSTSQPEQLPLEIEVQVRIQDDSGAAGLVFGSDENHRHYGFYPSAGAIRLTRFDGPDVFSWQILDQVESESYRPGEWNTLKVRIEKDKIIGYVNDVLILENNDAAWREGKVGVAQFRGTPAMFKGFRWGESLTQEQPSSEQVQDIAEKLSGISGMEKESVQALAKSWGSDIGAAKVAIDERKRQLEKELSWIRELEEATRLQSIYDRILELVHKSEPDNGNVDLAEVALWIAGIHNPDLEVDLYLSELDLIADEIKNELEDCADQRERFAALKKYFFEEAGFRGSRGDFYHPENSFLNEAMDDREGIPITLSVLFIALGERIGIEGLAGVSAPGRFFVRWDPEANGYKNEEAQESGERAYELYDIFDGGKKLSLATARALSWSIGGSSLSETQLKPAAHEEIASRMIRNLIGIHLSRREESLAIPYLNLALAIDPESVELRLQRAIAWMSLGNRSNARADLRWALDHPNEEFNYHEIRRLYDSL